MVFIHCRYVWCGSRRTVSCYHIDLTGGGPGFDGDSQKEKVSLLCQCSYCYADISDVGVQKTCYYISILYCVHTVISLQIFSGVKVGSF